VKRKGPGLAIEITRPGIITQAEIARVSTLQAAAWQAEKAAQRAAMKLEARLKAGWAVEPGPLHFDSELGMVRRKVG
jgi:hypothetical protein